MPQSSIIFLDTASYIGKKMQIFPTHLDLVLLIKGPRWNFIKIFSTRKTESLGAAMGSAISIQCKCAGQKHKYQHFQHYV